MLERPATPTRESAYVLIDEPPTRRRCLLRPRIIALAGSVAAGLLLTTAGLLVRWLPARIGQLALAVSTDVDHQLATAAGDHQRPIVLMHGLLDSSENAGFASVCESARRFTGAHVVCAPVANGWSSITSQLSTQARPRPLLTLWLAALALPPTAPPSQVEQFAALVAADEKLKGGFHAVGFSQGALVVRGYIEQYNAPPVRRYVSVVGPQAGVGGCPLSAYPWLCAAWLMSPYNAPVAFSSYWKGAADRAGYLRQSPWLASANNERALNATYRARMRQLELLVLVRALNDTTIIPNESEQFGFWPWGDADGAAGAATAVPMRDSDGYRSDALGLRTLDESGRLKEYSYEGEHMRFTDEFWRQTVLPLLLDGPEPPAARGAAPARSEGVVHESER